MKKQYWLSCVTALLIGSLAGCANMQASPRTVADAAAADPQLTTLNRLVKEAGLAETLQGSGPYTVLAPSDDAFKALKPADLQALSADRERLKAVLSHHVLPGRLSAKELKDGPVKTVAGSTLTISHAGQFVTVEDAMVVQADRPAANGTLHVIDRVLMPPKK